MKLAEKLLSLVEAKKLKDKYLLSVLNDKELEAGEQTRVGFVAKGAKGPEKEEASLKFNPDKTAVYSLSREKFKKDYKFKSFSDALLSIEKLGNEFEDMWGYFSRLKKKRKKGPLEGGIVLYKGKEGVITQVSGDTLTIEFEDGSTDTVKLKDVELF